MKTTTKKMMALAAITSAVLLTGCQKDLYDPNYVDSKDAPISGIPSDFNWSTISSVNLTVNVDDQYLGQYNYVVEVFDQNPIIDNNAKLLTKGLAKQDQAFVTTFTIPQALKTVYIRQTAPNGLKIVRSYDLSGSTLVCDFRATATKSIATKSVVTRSSIAGTTFTTPSTAIEINSSTPSYYNLTSGNSYVIKKGNVYNGNINSWNSLKTYLYVEGEWQISSDVQLGNSTIVVLQNEGKITFNNGAKLTIQGSKEYPASLWIMQGGILNPDKKAGVTIYETNYGSCYNLGTMYVNSIILDSQTTLDNTGTIINTGDLTSSNTTSINNDGTFQVNNITLSDGPELNNSGTILSSGKLTISNSNTKINNNGKLTISELSSSSQAVLNNNCYFKVNGNAECGQIKCTLGNSTYFGAKTITTKNGAAEFNMSASSILEAIESADFIYQNIIKGANTGTDYAVAKFKKVTAGNSGLNISGNVEFECSDYTQNTNNDTYIKTTSSVQLVTYGSPTVTIPTDLNGCTGPGSTPKIEDKTDTNYPLIVNLGTTYTYAMEDLWPNYGDYDMNDIVVAIKPQYTLSSANYVQSMTFTTTLKAIGASKSLAAAIQLDNISDADVTNVTYSTKSTDGSVFAVGSNKTESFNTSENAKAVIPLFDNAHQFLGSTGITNTVKSGTTAPEKSVTVTVTFITNKVKPADISNIATALNFFIVTDKQKTNRTEVHLRGFNATSHANTSLFGTGVDNSKTGLSYESNGNLVWGMVIPVNFKYPLESTSILTAYPEFKPWAQSGGKENQTWYDTPKTGTTF